MRPYSNDLRQRVFDAMQRRDATYAEIADRFSVSISFIVRLLQRHRATDSVLPKPHAGSPPLALSPQQLEKLRQLVDLHPDATLAQLRDFGGFTCSVMGIFRALRRLGITRKKKSLYASQRNRPDVQKKRENHRKTMRRVAKKRLIFLDETGIATDMTPRYGRAERGKRVVDSVPASWKTVTVIAAIGLDGVKAPLAFEGATDAMAFRTYAEEVLAKELKPGDLVLMDNLKAHKDAEAVAAIEKAGAKVVLLPQYSPDLNPIEKMWSKVKQYLRRAKARTVEKLYEVLGEALKQVSRLDIRGWFRSVGLCATRS